MSDSTFLAVNAAALLAFGRNPVPTRIEPDVSTAAPESGATFDKNIGIPIEDGVTFQAHIATSLRAGYVSAFVNYSDELYSAGNTYTFTINGTDYTTTGQATRDLAIAALVSAINADAVDDTSPRAVLAEPSPGVIQAWVYTPASESPEYAFTPPEADAMEVLVDALNVTVRLWLKPKSLSGTSIQIPWCVPVGGDLGVISLNTTMRLDYSGYDRATLQIIDVTPRPGQGEGVVPLALLWLAACVEEA